MKKLFCLILICSMVIAHIGCNENAINATGSTDLKIEALVASPTIVGAGETSMITCQVTGSTGGTLEYEWEATGAYGYLSPMDSICIFSSPICHSGPATVIVTVLDGNGGSVTGSVNLN